MTVSVTIYTLQCVPSKMHQVFIYIHTGCGLSLVLDLVKCLLIWYSPKVSKSAPRLHFRFCRGTSQLARSTCISFCVLLFMLLIPPYNSLYYNYIVIMQWMVGWFGDQGKKGVCIGKKGVCISKKVHCGPVLQATKNWRCGRAWNEAGHLAL